jgi:adenylate kinase
MRMLIMGPQGAGKGTQAALLTRELGIPHVSTGDLFRANIAAGSELGVLVKGILDSGALVPDEITQRMLAARLAEPDAEPGYLLDGFPRNITQADWLTELLLERVTPIQKVIVLTAPDVVLVERMLERGRADDTVEAIRRRLDTYHADTKPLIDYYGDLVVEIDGEGSVAEVNGRILDAIGAPRPSELPDLSDV